MESSAMGIFTILDKLQVSHKDHSLCYFDSRQKTGVQQGGKITFIWHIFCK